MNDMTYPQALAGEEEHLADWMRNALLMRYGRMLSPLVTTSNSRHTCSDTTTCFARCATLAHRFKRRGLPNFVEKEAVNGDDDDATRNDVNDIVDITHPGDDEAVQPLGKNDVDLERQAKQVQRQQDKVGKDRERLEQQIGWNHSHMCNFYIPVVIGPRGFTTI